MEGGTIAPGEPGRPAASVGATPTSRRAPLPAPPRLAVCSAGQTVGGGSRVAEQVSLTSIDKAGPGARETDVHGMTHAGKVREDNQDAFLIASLHHTLVVHDSSLFDVEPALFTSGRRGMLFLVADGVGGGSGGADASQSALRAAAGYVCDAMDHYSHNEPAAEPRFIERMLRAVELTHAVVREEAEKDESRRGMATTLTMVTVMWPRAHLVHVGDSRCYRLREGVLKRLTKDQTMAQMLLDEGKLSPAEAEQSRLRNVLWSAVGAPLAEPVMTSADVRWEDRMLLCSDGLTKHVSDEEIGEILGRPQSSKLICRDLIDLVLRRGATDNVTVIVGQMHRPAPRG